ncbi:MAG: hypothetical protein ABR553_09315 [Gammaproteobacteria bacterium]
MLTANNTDIEISDGVSTAKDDNSGYSISGSIRLPRSFYAAASYEDAEVFGIDFTNYSVGIGAFTSVADSVDLFAELAYVNEEIDTGSASDDDSGAGITLGVRGLWTSVFEAEARYRYADFGGGSAPMHSFYLSGMYKITPQYGVGLSYRNDAMEDDGIEFDRDVFGVFARVTF